MTVAKPLAGGLPMGAVLMTEEVASALKPGDHATTFGGGPVVCAAALAVLDVIESEGLVSHAEAMGTYLTAAIRAAIPSAVEVRGVGLLVAIELSEPRAADVVQAALERGLIINNIGPTTIRLAPPLIVDEEQIDSAVAVLADILPA
jgi:acetylornithine aminotransferase